MMKINVDLVLTVHNSERYLQECLLSIENQKYDNMFLIIIDDGSRDKSFDIICQFKSQTHIPTTIIRNKKALGVSKARNIGINIASHDFITFIDSDDLLRPDHVNLLVDLAKHTDDGSFILISSERIRSKRIGKYINRVPFEHNSKKMPLNSALLNVIGMKKIQGFVTGKLFNLNFIKMKNLQFDNNLKICEDFLFVCQYIILSGEGIIYSPNVTYLYRINESSVLFSGDSKNSILSKSRNELLAYSKISRLLTSQCLDNKTIKFFKVKLLLVVNNLLKVFISIDNWESVDQLSPFYWELFKNNVVNLFLSKYITFKAKVGFFTKVFNNLLYLDKMK